MNAQEQHWAGDQGNAYTGRNRVVWEKRVEFWQRMVEATRCSNALEVGCNAGWNMRALKVANPWVMVRGVDLNREAVDEALANQLNATVLAGEKVGKVYTDCFDLVFTVGVLIHVAPEQLHEVMCSIIAASRRYVLAVEYEADEEEMVEYRGEPDKLWRRPFGKLYEGLGLKPFLSGDAGEGFDRCTYWLMEKP